jgi:hypothetical protein
MTLRRFNDSLRSILDERRRVDAELRPTRVESRNDDGTLQIRPLHGECVARAPACGLYVGQTFESPCSAPFRLVGAAGIPMVSSRRTAATMLVTSIDPSLFSRGQSYTVTITGLGFTALSAFEFLMPGTETINPDVTITDTRYISATECEVDITIAADADLIPTGTGDLAYENVGLPIF